MAHNTTQRENQKENGQSLLMVDTKRALIGGIIAGAAILLGSIAINVGSGGDARILLEAMLPSVRFLCAAVMTASGTILALMLTMLSMGSTKERQFKADFYDRIKQIALMDSSVFAGAIVLLLFISIPLSESQDVPENWFEILYYVTLVSATVLGGVLIAIVLMLYNAIAGVIRMLHPEKESQLMHGSK